MSQFISPMENVYAGSWQSVACDVLKAVSLGAGPRVVDAEAT